MSATVYVLLMTLGACLIGFAIAWVIKQPAFIELTNSLRTTENKLQSLESEYSNLSTYANELQKEKEQLLKANDRLTDKLLSLTNTTNRLRAQKTVIFDNYDNEMIDTANFDQKINDLNAEIGKLNEEIEVVKGESMQMKIRYDELQKENRALLEQLKSRNGSA